MFRSLGAAGWIAANLIGVAAFIWWAATCCWIEPELSNVPGASGGAAAVWALGPLLMFAAFAIANLAWAAAAAVRCVRAGRWTYLANPLVILAIWATAFVVDGLRHGA